MKEIEDFLRENRPITKDDPTFILETQRRMEQVEGIKGEVDRQRRHGRVALILALAVGLAFVWYRRMSYRTFGGITGDLAGWFVTVAELMAMIAGWIAGML